MNPSAKVCLLLVCISFASLVSPYSAAQTNFKKVGDARMEYLFWDVYDASLYTPSGQYESGSNPVKFTLTYLRDFAAKDIVKATREQWQHLGKTDLAPKYASQLLAMWPDIKKGESLSLKTSDSGVARFYHDGELLGEISDPDFAAEFLAIWLSPQTSEPKLRKQLLGI